jgi:hypothetical protein
LTDLIEGTPIPLVCGEDSIGCLSPYLVRDALEHGRGWAAGTP